jgi:hypothetical protein
MQETNRLNPTESDDFLLTVNFPPNGLDLKRIMLAVSDHLPYRKLCFAPKFGKYSDVIIPTLRFLFYTYPKDGYLVVNYKKKVKIKMVMDGNRLSEQCVDVLCKHLMSTGINDFKF